MPAATPIPMVAVCQPASRPHWPRVPDSRRNVIDGLIWPPDANPCTSLSSTRATGAAIPIVDHEGSRPMAAVART